MSDLGRILSSEDKTGGMRDYYDVWEMLDRDSIEAVYRIRFGARARVKLAYRVQKGIEMPFPWVKREMEMRDMSLGRILRTP